MCSNLTLGPKGKGVISQKGMTVEWVRVPLAPVPQSIPPEQRETEDQFGQCSGDSSALSEEINT
jgi:hypothetical protein